MATRRKYYLEPTNLTIPLEYPVLNFSETMYAEGMESPENFDSQEEYNAYFDEYSKDYFLVNPSDAFKFDENTIFEIARNGEAPIRLVCGNATPYDSYPCVACTLALEGEELSPEMLNDPTSVTFPFGQFVISYAEGTYEEAVILLNVPAGEVTISIYTEEEVDDEPAPEPAKVNPLSKNITYVDHPYNSFECADKHLYDISEQMKNQPAPAPTPTPEPTPSGDDEPTRGVSVYGTRYVVYDEEGTVLVQLKATADEIKTKLINGGIITVTAADVESADHRLDDFAALMLSQAEASDEIMLILGFMDEQDIPENDYPVDAVNNSEPMTHLVGQAMLFAYSPTTLSYDVMGCYIRDIGDGYTTVMTYPASDIGIDTGISEPDEPIG